MLTNELSEPNKIFYKKVTAHDEKPDDPFYSEENIVRLKKSAEQLERGQVVTKTLDELRKLVYG